MGPDLRTPLGRMPSDLCALRGKAPVSLDSDKTQTLLIAQYCQPPVSLSELTDQECGPGADTPGKGRSPTGAAHTE